MLLYLCKRLGLAVAILVTTMITLFSLVYLVPGDPASVALGPRATPAMKHLLQVKMGLDQPIPAQLIHFMWNVLHGDLGTDVWTGRSVAASIADVLPYTLVLTGAGLGWAVLVGIPMGAYSAAKPNSVADKLAGLVSVGTIAIPAFVVAIYALVIVSVKLHLLPAIGAGPEGDYVAQARHLILPAFAVGLGWVGYIARMVRASMVEVLGENHIRMARAFGLPERQVIYGYALRIAVLPTVALLGIGIGNLLSGAVFAEIVFARPGIGKLTYDAVLTRNYPVVMSCVLVTTALYILCTLCADLLLVSLDPRLRDGL